MIPRMTFEGLFRSSSRMNLVPGAWYLGFNCAACGKSIAVLDDPTGSGGVEAGGPAEFEVQCPHCGETRLYPAAGMRPWQASAGGPAGLE